MMWFQLAYKNYLMSCHFILVVKFLVWTKGRAVTSHSWFWQNMGSSHMKAHPSQTATSMAWPMNDTIALQSFFISSDYDVISIGMQKLSYVLSAHLSTIKSFRILLISGTGDWHENSLLMMSGCAPWCHHFIVMSQWYL